MQKNVLITGGSSGIGFELAKIFGQNNYQLILVAREIDKLLEAGKKLRDSKFSVKTIAKDLIDPTSPSQIYEQLQNDKIQIDVLVNNAGFATYGPFTETDLDKELSELQVNIVALTHLTKLFARDMVKRRDGKILNVASTAAFTPGPLMAVYYASKSYVLSFSEALREELLDSGVHVTALCPGPTDTGFVKRAHLEKSKLFRGNNLSVDFVSKKAFEGLMKNKTIVVPGLKDALLIEALRFIPRSLTTKLIKFIQEEAH